MPIPRTAPRALALAILLAGGATGARAAEAVFDFYISGIRAGEMSLRTDEADGTYTAASRIATAGLVGFFAHYYYDGEAEGRLGADGGVEPRRFVARSKSPRAERLTEIDWEDGTPVRVSVDPPRQSAPEPADQGGTLDPVSAGFALLRDMDPDRLCDGTVDIFDGSRRSRLTLGAPVAGDEGIVCEGTYARLEGEAHTMSSQREFPFRLIFRPNDAGLAQLDRIETRTNFGLAVLERRS